MELAALDVATDERGDREVLLGQVAGDRDDPGRSSPSAPGSRSARTARAGGRDRVPARGLLEVVGDDRLKLGHHGQLALDEVAAAVLVGGDVDEAHDAEDALAVDDALAGADRVAAELDALVRRAARRVGRWTVAVTSARFQVALDP